EIWNAAATEKLSRQLQVAGRVFFPVTGCSPDLAHQEPGFGVVCQSSEEVVELGRDLRQEAVFWVENGIVHLLPCGSGERVVLGAWTKLALPQPASNGIGILAYGSLINDPGVEIEPLIVERISTRTPFPVEYARLSKSRGGGPTVVP